jgi:hypothetical protein
MNRAKPLAEPYDVLFRIQRGLVGYVSYLAACEMNEAFSEYVLYEPILRVLTARGYTVQCEVVCPGIDQPPVGDKKKLDFVALNNGLTLALEVKWVRNRRPSVEEDLRKLIACRDAKGWRAFLCIFGTESCIANIQLPAGLRVQGKAIIADLTKTRYGCRVYTRAKTSPPLRCPIARREMIGSTSDQARSVA